MSNDGQISLEFGDDEAETGARDRLSSENIDIRVPADATEAAEACRRMAGGRSLVGLDIETAPLASYRDHPRAGLDPHLSRIRLVQVYDGGGEVLVFDLDRIGGVEPLAPLWELPLVAHSALFEIKHLMACGAEPARVGCTLLQANALDGGMVGLADLAERRLGWTISKKLQVSDWSRERLSDGQLAYAALDAVAAQRIARVQHPLLRDGGRLRLYQLARDAQQAIARLELDGIAFDTDAHNDLIEQWRAVADRTERELADVLGPGVRASSGKQLSDWLVAHLDDATLDAWPRTRTGQLRTDAATLARHPDHPLVRPLLAHKEAATRLASFGPSFAEHVNPASGRIHANFRLGATASGRMACFDPNLQNPPREAAFRALFRAPEGRQMVVADYAQIELRVAAEVAGDQTMLESYRRGEDLHRRTAAAVAGVDLDQVTAEQRQLAKAVNFGLLYGQGARGLASYARGSYGVNMTEAEALAAREAFFTTYSGLATWQRESAREAERAMLVRTRSGRVFDFRRSRFGYSYPEALNIPIQGAAAEVLMAALGALPERLADLDAKLVNVVHDELVLEVADGDVQATRAALEEAMTAGMLSVFPNAPTEGLVEASVGQSWADAK